MTNISDEQLDKFIKDELVKDIDQSDKIDPEVERQMGEMGWLWNIVHKKLHKDSICFKCKRKVDFSSEKLRVLTVDNKSVDKGLCGFVSVCENCHTTLEKENKQKKDD